MSIRASLAAILLAPLLAAPAHSSEPDGDGPAEGWGYLYAQCMQEPVAEPRNICETSAGDEPVLAIIVSNVVRLGDGSPEPYARFRRELMRLEGLDMEPREVTPFATWQEAEASLNDMLAANRRVEEGRIAFLALSLEPERLAEEPSEEEMAQSPPPLPDVTLAFPDEVLEVWRTGEACGLRRADGSEILPEQVHNPFGEAGEGCPFQVAPGYGLYAFHVPRNGMICGEAGICTEIYGPEGNLLLVADYSPTLLTVHRSLQNLGLLVTGERVQRLWSFPERRYVSGNLPFIGLGPDDRVLVGEAIVRHNRLAVPFERHLTDATEPFTDVADEYALFFLDTRRFEDVALTNAAFSASAAEPPAFARYEAEKVEPCRDDSEWLVDRDHREEQYLSNSYYDFDKNFRVLAANLARDIEGAKTDPARISQLAASLDTMMLRLGRLIDGVDAPADSLAVARVAQSFEFQQPEIARLRDGPAVWLRAALALEIVVGQDLAFEQIDAFLTSLGRVRYGLRRIEAAGEGADRAAAFAALERDASTLVRDWRDGFDPALKEALFGGPLRLDQRLHRQVVAMCTYAE